MYLIEFEGGGRTGADMNSLFLKKTMTMTIGCTRRSSRLFFVFPFFLSFLLLTLHLLDSVSIYLGKVGKVGTFFRPLSTSHSSTPSSKTQATASPPLAESTWQSPHSPPGVSPAATNVHIQYAPQSNSCKISSEPPRARNGILRTPCRSALR